jgi:hypothetical protein
LDGDEGNEGGQGFGKVLEMCSGLISASGSAGFSLRTEHAMATP